MSVSDDELAVSVRQVEQSSAVEEGYQSARFCASPQCELTSASCRGRRGETAGPLLFGVGAGGSCGDEQSNVTRGVR